MLFNSPAFIFLFFPVAILVFWCLGRWTSHKVAAGWLALCSLFFYGWWDVRFISLLLASIAFNYGMGVMIERARRSGYAGAVLALAVASNLSLLGLFKYADFFIGALNQFAGTSLTQPHFLLPLGISFFTFTQIAFLVDVRRGIAKEYSPVHYLLFVTYFPHLIAGPILHHKEMMPQFAAPATYSPQLRSVALGLTLFAFGLFKKTVLADSIAPHATAVFTLADRGEPVALLQAWTGALAYTMQLYFDFSGYVDMAIGCSKMIGIDLPINFNSPYKSVNITDFWRRWHMTLGRFFRDYVYIPLGGNRHGLHRAQLNIFVVMLLSGLWHGAGWTFIVWGALHATMSVINNYWRAFRASVLKQDLERSTLVGRVFSILVTFICVLFCWVFFRAQTLAGAWQIIKAMFDISYQGYSQASGIAISDIRLALAVEVANYHRVMWQLAGLLLICWTLPNTFQITQAQQSITWRPGFVWWLTALAAMLTGSYVMLYGINTVNEFLYFNF